MSQRRCVRTGTARGFRWCESPLSPPHQQQQLLMQQQQLESPASPSHSSRILLSISMVPAAVVAAGRRLHCRRSFPRWPLPHSRHPRHLDCLHPPPALPRPKQVVTTTTHQPPIVHRPFLLPWCQVPAFLILQPQSAGREAPSQALPLHCRGLELSGLTQ